MGFEVLYFIHLFQLFYLIFFIILSVETNPFFGIYHIFRLATSPLLSLERHQKGVLALSWCQQDPDLLLSGSKDGKVLCWNPNNNVAVCQVFFLCTKIFRMSFYLRNLIFIGR